MSLIPNTYDGLVSAIRALAEDDGTEFEDYVPTAVSLAEERLLKDLDTQGLKVSAVTTATQGSQILAKPSGYRFGHSLYFVNTSSSEIVAPGLKTDTFVRDYWPNTATEDVPKYYADLNNTEWVLAPTPDDNYVFTVQYVKSIDALGSANQTNYYTDFCSDALYYATMSFMADFMKDYQTIKVWENRYSLAIQSKNNEGRRSRRSDGTIPRNPEGGINTVTGGV
jgi:hypothetical protein